MSGATFQIHLININKTVVPITLMKFVTKLGKGNFCIIPKARLGVGYQRAFANLSASLFPSIRDREGCPDGDPSSQCAEPHDFHSGRLSMRPNLGSQLTRRCMLVSAELLFWKLWEAGSWSPERFPFARTHLLYLCQVSCNCGPRRVRSGFHIIFQSFSMPRLVNV